MSESQLNSIPDKLFKYVTAEGGLATLKGETVSVMFSKPSDLNDPFEFLPALNGLCFKTKDMKKGLEFLSSPFLSATANELRTEVEGNWFITSLSKTDRNVRMWAQYGKEHTGVKITFNLSKPPLRQQKLMMMAVDYSKKRRVNVSDFKRLPSEAARGMRFKKAATQKGKDWEHEEEVRWFLRDEGGRDGEKGEKQVFSKGLVDGKMRAFMQLPHACIQRVTVGYLSSPSLFRSVLELRKMHHATWQVAKAKLSLNSFQFEEEVLVPAG